MGHFVAVLSGHVVLGVEAQPPVCKTCLEEALKIFILLYIYWILVGSVFCVFINFKTFYILETQILVLFYRLANGDSGGWRKLIWLISDHSTFGIRLLLSIRTKVKFSIKQNSPPPSRPCICWGSFETTIQVDSYRTTYYLRPAKSGQGASDSKVVVMENVHWWRMGVGTLHYVNETQSRTNFVIVSWWFNNKNQNKVFYYS